MTLDFACFVFCIIVYIIILADSLYTVENIDTCVGCTVDYVMCHFDYAFVLFWFVFLLLFFCFDNLFWWYVCYYCAAWAFFVLFAKQYLRESDEEISDVIIKRTFINTKLLGLIDWQLF